MPSPIAMSLKLLKLCQELLQCYHGGTGAQSQTAEAEWLALHRLRIRENQNRNKLVTPRVGNRYPKKLRNNRFRW